MSNKTKIWTTTNSFGWMGAELCWSFPFFAGCFRIHSIRRSITTNNGMGTKLEIKKRNVERKCNKMNVECSLQVCIHPANHFLFLLFLNLSNKPTNCFVVFKATPFFEYSKIDPVLPPPEKVSANRSRAWLVCSRPPSFIQLRNQKARICIAHFMLGIFFFVFLLYYWQIDTPSWTKLLIYSFVTFFSPFFTIFSFCFFTTFKAIKICWQRTKFSPKKFDF